MKTVYLHSLNKNSYGLVVQLVRMPACHAGGRGFESRPDREGLPNWEAFLRIINTHLFYTYTSYFPSKNLN